MGYNYYIRLILICLQFGIFWAQMIHMASLPLCKSIVSAIQTKIGFFFVGFTNSQPSTSPSISSSNNALQC